MCSLFFMDGKKLIKLRVSLALHRRITTNAASKGKTIKPYLLDFLEENIPREITFPKAEENALESTKNESRQSTVRRRPKTDVGDAATKNVRDTSRKKTPRKA